MKRISLISLTLIASLSGACSSQSDQSAPEPEQKVAPRKSVSQALTGVTLQEVPVSAAIQEAVAGQATVRAFQIQVPEGGSVSVADVMPVALQSAAADLSKDWQQNPERNVEQTHVALKFLEGVLPAMEAQVGTDEEPTSGYYHSFETAELDRCNHGDFYGVVFPQAGKLFTIEVAGTTDC
ncbi:MAG TPA: hypothetical protein VF815_37400 [Myxococcaceae bacterium]|jgi:glucose/arabinose dehydrogenase